MKNIKSRSRKNTTSCASKRTSLATIESSVKEKALKECKRLLQLVSDTDCIRSENEDLHDEVITFLRKNHENIL